ncbi:thermonuclease family protein [Desulfovibrio sp. OttesenSCG-928-C06]|nr:thermonuclease family protein [Desulfovibrio sp. OttesenSCG-928-C06]
MSIQQPSKRAGNIVKKSNAAIRMGRRVSRQPYGQRRFMPRNMILLVLVIVALVGAYSYGRGKVVKIGDGDTVSILNSDGSFGKIRLYGIDCPENGQPGGAEAAAFTSDLAFLEEVKITTVNIDQYGRTVGMVHLPNGRMLNEELLRNGHAWVYRAYCKEPWCASWLQLERQAKAERKGLWAQKKPTPPWEWRKKNNSRR